MLWPELKLMNQKSKITLLVYTKKLQFICFSSLLKLRRKRRDVSMHVRFDLRALLTFLTVLTVGMKFPKLYLFSKCSMCLFYSNARAFAVEVFFFFT